MKRTTFNVLFFIKRQKLLRNAEAPVYLRITINGERAECSVKRSVNPEIWDTKKNSASGRTQNAIETNNYLNSVKGQIYTHFQVLQEKGKEITALTLLNMFLGKGEKKWMLLELFEEHNNQFGRLVGKEYCKATYTKYKTSLNHLREFLKSGYNKNEIELKEIDLSFVHKYDFYLKTIYNCQHNSALNHIKALNKVLKLALINGYINRNPIDGFKLTRKEVTREKLTVEEIDKIKNLTIECERLDRIRDIFIFLCYSGLSYKDLEYLTQDNIQMGIDGKEWIVGNRSKTKKEYSVPLLDINRNILDKYLSHPCHLQGKLLPVPSNQKMNTYLKEIQFMCGITKTLHCHIARHSFATSIALLNNVPIESLSRMLGHSNISITQHYGKVLDRKLSNDAENLRKLGT